MTYSAALPFTLRRSNDIFSGEGITTTTETVHGLLRLVDDGKLKNDNYGPLAQGVRFDFWESFRLVQSSPGVTGMVKFGGRYPALPDLTIESLRAEMPVDRPLEIRQII